MGVGVGFSQPIGPTCQKMKWAGMVHVTFGPGPEHGWAHAFHQELACRIRFLRKSFLIGSKAAYKDVTSRISYVNQIAKIQTTMNRNHVVS